MKSHSLVAYSSLIVSSNPSQFARRSTHRLQVHLVQLDALLNLLVKHGKHRLVDLVETGQVACLRLLRLLRHGVLLQAWDGWVAWRGDLLVEEADVLQNDQPQHLSFVNT